MNVHPLEVPHTTVVELALPTVNLSIVFTAERASAECRVCVMEVTLQYEG